MSPPRVFVSHRQQDDEFTQRLVGGLHRVGAEVWVGQAGILDGNVMPRSEEALAHCEWMVLVLTPAAIASPEVQDEVSTALRLVQQGTLHAVIPVLAAPCAPGTIPPEWEVGHRYDATQDYLAAMTGILSAIGLSPTAPPVPPTDRFPPRLTQLGFVVRAINHVEVIVPPLCDAPAGAFWMGSNPKQQAFEPERPQHLVMLPAYQIARYPVTVAEYACFVYATDRAVPTTDDLVGWGTQLRRLDHPVVCVTWHDTMDYAAWLAQLTGEPWRLPTEAEWEKAARWDPVAQHSRTYPWGDAFDPARCNVDTSGVASHLGTTTPVGTYPNGASPCGAQDMTGNVCEWTSSLFTPYPAGNVWERLSRRFNPGLYTYNFTEGRDPADAANNRVLRGGSYYVYPLAARAACRLHSRWLATPGDPTPVDRSADGGFRMVRAAPGA
jgi:toxoflavin biosynthesis protein ToxD